MVGHLRFASLVQAKSDSTGRSCRRRERVTPERERGGRREVNSEGSEGNLGHEVVLGIKSSAARERQTESKRYKTVTPKEGGQSVEQGGVVVQVVAGTGFRQVSASTAVPLMLEGMTADHVESSSRHTTILHVQCTKVAKHTR